MEYQAERDYIILDEGVYNNVKYKIVSYGTHPCCYVFLPKGHKYYGKNYDDIDIDCHGGLTYSKEDDNSNWVIGWDYAHFDDYTMLSGVVYPYAKKWTTEEMLEEVKRVIGQL